eukprot:1357776-Amphidinium_carterae.1
MPPCATGSTQINGDDVKSGPALDTTVNFTGSDLRYPFAALFRADPSPRSVTIRRCGSTQTPIAPYCA